MSYYPPEFHSLAGTAEIRIRAARPGGPLAASWLFLVVWLLVGAGAISDLLRPVKAGAPTFLRIWLLGWLVGGISLLGKLGWHYLGEEVISLTNGVLSIRQQAGWLHRTKAYDIAHITSLRSQEAVPDGSLFRQRRGPLLGEGAVLFDYGARTVAFGLNLPVDEGDQVVAFLHRHHVDAAGR